jgi:hypothetical protein
MHSLSPKVAPTYYRWGVRAAFVAVVLSAPVGLVVRSVVGEPYPWLFQPSFAYVEESTGVVSYEIPDIVALTESGQSETLELRRVMPWTRPDQAVVFASAFGQAKSAEAPDTAEWMFDRLQAAYPANDFVEVTITWYQQKYDLDTKQTSRGPALREFVIRVRHE